MDAPNPIKCVPNYSDLKPDFDCTITVAADCRDYFIWNPFTCWRDILEKNVLTVVYSFVQGYEIMYNTNT